MDKVSFISCALAFWCLNTSGQTNAPAASGELFSLPSLQLRPLGSEPTEPVQAHTPGPGEGPQSHKASGKPAKVSPDVAVTSNPGHLPEQMTLTSDERDLALRIYDRLEKGGHLTRREPRSDNAFVRSMDAVFEPEVIRIGKVSVSCSIITAIKRKNPLCLINPLFLGVSW
jgi:hypothetical protein